MTEKRRHLVSFDPRQLDLARRPVDLDSYDILCQPCDVRFAAWIPGIRGTSGGDIVGPSPFKCPRCGEMDRFKVIRIPARGG